MVPGGATGVVQGPDTDLHAWLEAELLELQAMEEHEKLQKRPRKTERNRYAAIAWTGSSLFT